MNVREVLFFMINVSFDMIFGAYLIGDVIVLITKGSRTERFRDKMKEFSLYSFGMTLLMGKKIAHRLIVQGGVH